MPSPNTTRVDLPNGAQAHARRSPPNSSPDKTKRLSLALQGGGALGAFTWGVLDRLLEADTITFDAVSGASVGAMNAVVLASGLAQGGPEEARASLERVWRGQRGWSAKPPGFVERGAECDGAAALAVSVQPLGPEPLARHSGRRGRHRCSAYQSARPASAWDNAGQRRSATDLRHRRSD